MIDRLSILTTGGTIDKLYFDALSEFQVGEPQIGSFLREANVRFEFSLRSLLRKDSLDLTDDDRALIVKTAQADACEHILITHGTDTMLVTARAIKRQLSHKVVVLTGAMLPATQRGSDAVFNIGFAIGVLSTLPHGVYVAMNGRVFDPDRAQKNRASNRFENV